MRRVVFETAIFRRIVRRRNYYTVRQTRGSATVIRKNGRGDGRSGRIALGAIDHGFDTVCCEDLQDRGKRRFRQRVRIFAHVQRADDALLTAVFADRLGDSQNMCLIEPAAK